MSVPLVLERSEDQGAEARQMTRAGLCMLPDAGQGGTKEPSWDKSAWPGLPDDGLRGALALQGHGIVNLRRHC